MFIIIGHKVPHQLLPKRRKKSKNSTFFIKLRIEFYSLMEKRKKKRKEKKSVIIDVHVGLRPPKNKKPICSNCIKFNIFGSILKDLFYTNFTDNKIVVQNRFHIL